MEEFKPNSRELTTRFDSWMCFFFSDRICRIQSKQCQHSVLHVLFSRSIVVFGFMEILMVALLTVVGEREETCELQNGSHFSKAFF